MREECDQGLVAASAVVRAASDVEALQQGIGEARGILSALDALSPELNGQIDATWQVVQTRLDDFVSGDY